MVTVDVPDRTGNYGPEVPPAPTGCPTCIQESSGPTDLAIGAIAPGEIPGRTITPGTSFVGALAIQRFSVPIPGGVASLGNVDVAVDVTGSALDGIPTNAVLLAPNSEPLLWPANGAPVAVGCSATNTNEVTVTFLNIGALATGAANLPVTLTWYKLGV